MKRMHRAVALLLFLLFLMPGSWSLAEQGQEDPSAAEDFVRTAAGSDQGTENHAVPLKNYDEGLFIQIQETYRAAKKRSRRSSFKGYCGAYVANQLVVLGINTSYLSANGKNTYDIYQKISCTTGGYHVTTYGAQQYSLQEALTTIIGKDPSATNILVGFQKGVSKSGKKFGHVLFIHGIRNGKIYYSDSSARTVDKVKYKEGEPIVCSLASFVEEYAKYKLDGVVHFQKAENEQKLSDNQSSITEETTAISAEKLLAEG